MRIAQFSLTSFEQSIVNEIHDVIYSGSQDRQAVVYRTVEGWGYDECIDLSQRLHAYIFSYWFPTVWPFFAYTEYDITPIVGFQSTYMSYGSAQIVGFQYNVNSGELAVLFSPIRLRKCINDHTYNMSNIDAILDTVSSGSEKTVAKNIALKLIAGRQYYANGSLMKGLFQNNKGNCSAYSLAFYAACRRVGIRCEYYEGRFNGRGHAWNKIVFSDGTKLYYDLTRARGSSSPASYLGMTRASMGSYKLYEAGQDVMFWKFPSYLLPHWSW